MSVSAVVARKPLKRTDRLKRFAIPTKTLQLFPQFNGHKFVPVNFWQGPIIWSMVISTRTHGYKKPVISKGWIPFVRKNQLEVGDVVTIFRNEDETGIWYRIEIERGSKPLPALYNDLQVQQVTIFPSSNVNIGVADNNVLMAPRPTPVAVPTTHNSNVNVEVATNILAIKEETQLAPASVPPIAQKAEELSLKPDGMNLGLTLPSLVEVELKSTASVLQQIAHPTHYDTDITNSDNKFHLNLNLTLAQPVVACEGYQAPSMGLFGTEADNFNPGIVVN
ncbi:hypothetical protein SLEP1_g36581 [Rubroshorea leprosula]|uniref:TF-B3 domain-containing protein n=1 Tax=Rubroshorea leprosula TaxID=152421 RepID=A0AAV5KS52_9ROSI|nr:hypothetical protein SLEP1_g36581 [Rubroshorea leprosula]